MADRSQVTKITLAYLKDPKNMPKDNTPESEGLEADLENLELPEELEPLTKKKKKKDSDKFPLGVPAIEGTGEPGTGGRSQNDLFNKKKKEVY